MAPKDETLFSNTQMTPPTYHEQSARDTRNLS